jgi:predicted nucleic-acid-binding Zn-ribbon protein
MNPLGMFRADARAAVNIPDIERGRVPIFVNCLECGYYMFFKPETVKIF